MMLKQRLKEIAPDTYQGRLFLKIAGALVALAAGCHLVLLARNPNFQFSTFYGFIK